MLMTFTVERSSEEIKDVFIQTGESVPYTASYSMETVNLPLVSRRLLIEYGLVTVADLDEKSELKLSFVGLRAPGSYNSAKTWYTPDTRYHSKQEIFEAYLQAMGEYIKEYNDHKEDQ